MTQSFGGWCVNDSVVRVVCYSPKGWVLCPCHDQTKSEENRQRSVILGIGYESRVVVTPRRRARTLLEKHGFSVSV